MSLNSKIYKYSKLLRGKVLNMKPEMKVETTWYGGEHTGFAVYTKKLNNPIVYSFGVGTDISFDNELIKNHNAKVFAFDPTPGSIKWLETQNISENFVFSPVGISDKDGVEQFFLPEDGNCVSASTVVRNGLKRTPIDVPMKRLATLLQENNHTSIDILKIDIEGSEFSVVPDILKSNLNIDQLCLEVHDRFFDNGKQMLKEMLDLIKANGYVLIAVSDYFQELTFVKKNIL